MSIEVKVHSIKFVKDLSAVYICDFPFGIRGKLQLRYKLILNESSVQAGKNKSTSLKVDNYEKEILQNSFFFTRLCSWGGRGIPHYTCYPKVCEITLALEHISMLLSLVYLRKSTIVTAPTLFEDQIKTMILPLNNKTLCSYHTWRKRGSSKFLSIWLNASVISIIGSNEIQCGSVFPQEPKQWRAFV